MDDSKDRIKTSSVAAFMLMPQFRLSFQQFSFIIPVFMRTVAGMFEGAGLLPQDHPATRYGMEGVRKYGFFELIGEVWHRLRATAATPFQWGLFVAVVMMVVMIVIAMISVFLSLSGMFVGTAAAQIFGLRDSTGAALSTDISTMPSVGAYVVPPDTTGHGDYAIMILDKLLRQGTDLSKGPNAMQMAFGGLMQIYNSGIMVIAGVMLFWIILTIVVDTARTGQIGGGRHNLVWAPIRIVFALGLMVPLGSSGFSSGQYMVMKLAEMGSNFGSNAWTTYVTKVAKSVSMVGKVDSADATGLVKQYIEMWVCRIAYNGYNIQATGAVTGQLFNPGMITAVKNSGSDDIGKKSYSFTNRTSDNVCGTLTYPDVDYAELTGAKNQTDDKLIAAMAQYEYTMTQAYADFFIKAGNPDQGSAATGAEGGGEGAKKLACAFVSNSSLYGVAGENLKDKDVCDGDYSASCGAVAPAPGATAAYPKPSPCVTDLVKSFYEKTRKAQCGTISSDPAGCTGGAWGDLNAFTNSDDFLKDFRNRGWAGMGVWYRKISLLNTTVSRMQQYPVSISKGSFVIDMPGMFDLPKVFPGGDQLHKVTEILGQYDTWWATAVQPALSATPGLFSGDKVLGKKDAQSALDTFKAGDRAAVGNAVASKIAPNYKPAKFVKSMPLDLYPLAMLSMLGDFMLLGATMIYAGLIIIPVAIGALGTIPFFGGGAAAIATVISTNPLWAMLGVLAGALLSSGVMLSFWIPILPLIRTVFGVLTWMIAIFEAVVMVPVAALAHLTTEGEGLAGGAKGIWVIWLNILLRPVLMVIGFVGAMLGFNTFVVYFTHIFWGSLFESVGTLRALFGIVIYSVLYVGVIYMVANSIFKLIDLIPAAVAKYMGGHADTSFDQDASGFVSGAGGAMKGMAEAGAAAKAGNVKAQQKGPAGTPAVSEGKSDYKGGGGGGGKVGF
jgi:conjugal transfer/type IV secretion protein DotA/TraY